MNTIKLKKNALFNPEGDTDLRHRRMIGGNTTNLNDFNNMRYKWVSDWYRQAMNNFWIPEEINLTQDTKDYPHLDQAERTAYDKILSFLVFLDSLQSNNLPTISEYITANEVNLCLHIQAFQECVHSQSYSYMLDSICSPEKRNEILYQWKTDGHLLKRNTFIGNCYNEFQESQDGFTLMKTLIANYILEGIYFYSGFMFFYNLSRNGKMSGSAQEIRYINRDENTHLWLFRNIILELKKEEPDLFTPDKVKIYEYMMREDGSAIRRRRQCDACGKRFTTYEKVETIPLIVIKKDKNRETYDRSKIESGVIKSCHKRPVSAEAVTKCIDDIENTIFNMEVREIESTTIGEIVMDKIKDLDQVAYVRFASVYREFKDVNTFMDELGKLLTSNSEKR